jgi:hypothetical protein
MSTSAYKETMGVGGVRDDKSHIPKIFFGHEEHKKIYFRILEI